MTGVIASPVNVVLILSKEIRFTIDTRLIYVRLI